MGKTKIMNTYAIKQGYECWWELLHYCMKNGNVQYHIDKVTDLIQEELLKKASKQLILGQTLNKAQQSILNTEIL